MVIRRDQGKDDAVVLPTHQTHSYKGTEEKGHHAIGMRKAQHKPYPSCSTSPHVKSIAVQCRRDLYWQHSEEQSGLLH